MSDTPNRISRRGIIGLAAGGAFTAALTACSGKPSSSSSSRGTSPSPAAGLFPRTVKGVYGDVTVTERPKRVVALFDAYGDICVALGVQPVAVADSSAELLPWYRGRFQGKLDPALRSSNGKAAPERIASYRPDLVVGLSSCLDRELRAQFIKISPFYCGRVEGTDDWNHTVEDLSLLLTGSAAKGDEVKAQVADALGSYKARLKGSQGKEYMWVAASDQIYFGNGSALETLGLVAGRHQNASPVKTISYENIEQLNAPVLAITTDTAGRKKLEADPRFSRLPASKNGSIVWASDDQAAAMQHSCPSTFKYIAEWITPLLEKSALNRKS